MTLNYLTLNYKITAPSFRVKLESKRESFHVAKLIIQYFQSQGKDKTMHWSRSWWVSILQGKLCLTEFSQGYWLNLCNYYQMHVVRCYLLVKVQHSQTGVIPAWVMAATGQVQWHGTGKCSYNGEIARNSIPIQCPFVTAQMVAKEHLCERHTHLERLRCDPCETDLYVNAEKTNDSVSWI